MRYFQEQHVLELDAARKFAATNQRLSSSLPPASGARGSLDSLVQGSLVDLFAAYSMAVAPLPRSGRRTALDLPEISAAVSFLSNSDQGLLTLSVPPTVLDLMPPTQGGTLKRDWARELANQLVGRLKNRLLQFNVRLQVGISSLVEANKLSRQLESENDLRIYRGRTLRGEVTVTLHGMPDAAHLVYQGQATPRSEGEAILF